MSRFLSLMMILLLVSCAKEEKVSSRVDVLPYYAEATFTPHWFDQEDEVPDDFHRISPFSLINQSGNVITEKALDGKITVVDFFFTSCPGICPTMTANMADVQSAFIDDEEVLILSHSVTPEKDSVSVLREYAEVKGVVEGKWHLLTGDRRVIYDLGRNQYFVEEDMGLEKGPDDFIHTENFVLIDRQRRIRGIYNGLNEASVAQLIADVRALKMEG